MSANLQYFFVLKLYLLIIKNKRISRIYEGIIRFFINLFNDLLNVSYTYNNELLKLVKNI